MKSAVCIKHFAILTTLFLISRPLAPAHNPAQNADAVRANYTKHEFLIPMRDGVRLFTAVYTPKDASRPFPFLLRFSARMAAYCRTSMARAGSCIGHS